MGSSATTKSGSAASARAMPMRCRFEVELSRQEVPPLEQVEPGHKVACFNPVGAEEWEQTRQAVSR